MSINVCVDEDDTTLIKMEFRGTWTWPAYKRATQEVFDIAESVGQRIDVIVDLTEASTAPIESDNHALRDTFENAPGNYGMMVIIDADQFTTMIISMMQKFIPVLQRKIILTDTIPNAQSIINLQRAIDRRTRPLLMPDRRRV